MAMVSRHQCRSCDRCSSLARLELDAAYQGHGNKRKHCCCQVCKNTTRQGKQAEAAMFFSISLPLISLSLPVSLYLSISLILYLCFSSRYLSLCLCLSHCLCFFILSLFMSLPSLSFFPQLSVFLSSSSLPCCHSPWSTFMRQFDTMRDTWRCHKQSLQQPSSRVFREWLQTLREIR